MIRRVIFIIILSIVLFISMGDFSYKGASNSCLAIGACYFTIGIVKNNNVFNGINYSLSRNYKKENYFEFCERKKQARNNHAYLATIGGVWIIFSIVFASLYMR